MERPFCFVCGIECDSISTLNGKRSENTGCVADSSRSTRTGNTARACMEFIKRMRPPMFVLENVRNLALNTKQGSSNLHTLVEVANACGYSVAHKLLSPASFGIPQCRERYYIVGVLTADSCVNQIVDSQVVLPPWQSDVNDALSHMMIDPLPLCDFLLDDQDDEVLQALSAKQAGASRSSRRAGAKNKSKKSNAQGQPTIGPENDGESEVAEKYQVEHLAAFREVGVSWPPKLSEDQSRMWQSLGTRQKEMLWLEEETCGPADALPTWTCRDLNMTLGWSRIRSGVTPCIVSSSVMWVRGPVSPHTQVSPRVVNRVLTGRELLSLQGFSLQAQARAQVDAPLFSNKDRTDLAGNAFNGAVLVALLVATLSFAPLAAAIDIANRAFNAESKALRFGRMGGLALARPHGRAVGTNIFPKQVSRARGLIQQQALLLSGEGGISRVQLGPLSMGISRWQWTNRRPLSCRPPACMVPVLTPSISPKSMRRREESRRCAARTTAAKRRAARRRAV